MHILSDKPNLDLEGYTLVIILFNPISFLILLAKNSGYHVS